MKPNIRPDQYYEFYALRDIAAGEELIAEFLPK
jgi:SET domain-containing protein